MNEDVKGYEFSVTDFRVLVNVVFQSEIYTIHAKNIVGYYYQQNVSFSSCVNRYF